MVRRWIIRSIAILICAVCVGSSLIGTFFPIVGMVAIGGVFLRVDWMGSEMGLSVFNRPPEWDGWVYWPRSDQGKFAILQAIYDHQLHFAGFGYGRFENLYLLRLPLWFLSLLSVLLLLWIFRRTRAKSPPTAFPIEATQAVQKS